MGCRHSRPLLCFHASNIRTTVVDKIVKAILSLTQPHLIIVTSIFYRFLHAKLKHRTKLFQFSIILSLGKPNTDSIWGTKSSISPTPMQYFAWSLTKSTLLIQFNSVRERESMIWWNISLHLLYILSSLLYHRLKFLIDFENMLLLNRTK